ncbi:MAG: tyrosine-type recombinase/integrase [Gammaproteobacteria bacterium]|nr:tyrosine-type recombinase/integrase [Gammaproteobacteria bacterium]
MTRGKPVKLTKRAVDALRISSGDTVFWDRDLPGFGIRVHATGRKVWCVQVRDLRGKPRRVALGPLGELTPEAARRKATEVIDRIKQGLSPEPPPEMREPTVAEFAARYLESHVRVNLKPNTVDGIERTLRLHVLPRLGDLRLSEVDRPGVAALHHALRDHPPLANRAVLALSGMLRVARAWGVLPPGPNSCGSVRKYREEARERFLSPAEYRKLGAVLAGAEADGSELPSAIAAIRLLLLTGCRKNEIVTLKWDDIDRGIGEIRLRDGKTGLRQVPLTPAVESVLSGIPRKRGNPWVIAGRKAGGHLKGIDLAWRRLREKAGLLDVHIHDLRHSYASRSLALGEGLSTIGDLLGHRDVSTTARYAHLVKDAERASAARVGHSISSCLHKSEAVEPDPDSAQVRGS